MQGAHVTSIFCKVGEGALKIDLIETCGCLGEEFTLRPSGMPNPRKPPRKVMIESMKAGRR